MKVIDVAMCTSVNDNKKCFCDTCRKFRIRFKIIIIIYEIFWFQKSSLAMVKAISCKGNLPVSRLLYLDSTWTSTMMNFGIDFVYWKYIVQRNHVFNLLFAWLFTIFCVWPTTFFACVSIRTVFLTIFEGNAPLILGVGAP